MVLRRGGRCGARFSGGVHLDARKAATGRLPIVELPSAGDRGHPAPAAPGAAVTAAREGRRRGPAAARGSARPRASSPRTSTPRSPAWSGRSAPGRTRPGRRSRPWSSRATAPTPRSPSCLAPGRRRRRRHCANWSGRPASSASAARPSRRTSSSRRRRTRPSTRWSSTARSASPTSPPTTASWSSARPTSSAGHGSSRASLGAARASSSASRTTSRTRSPRCGWPGGSGIEVESLPATYPQGAEKQLIKVLLGREVPPPPGLPLDVGVVVQNVGTCAAVHDAVCAGRPLIDRVVTVAGGGVARPGNFRARVGTPLRRLARGLRRALPRDRAARDGRPDDGPAAGRTRRPGDQGDLGAARADPRRGPRAARGQPASAAAAACAPAPWACCPRRSRCAPGTGSTGAPRSSRRRPASSAARAPTAARPRSRSSSTSASPSCGSPRRGPRAAGGGDGRGAGRPGGVMGGTPPAAPGPRHAPAAPPEPLFEAASSPHLWAGDSVPAIMWTVRRGAAAGGRGRRLLLRRAGARRHRGRDRRVRGLRGALPAPPGAAGDRLRRQRGGHRPAPRPEPPARRAALDGRRRLRGGDLPRQARLRRPRLQPLQPRARRPRVPPGLLPGADDDLEPAGRVLRRRARRRHRRHPARRGQGGARWRRGRRSRRGT